MNLLMGTFIQYDWVKIFNILHSFSHLDYLRIVDKAYLKGNFAAKGKDKI